MSKKYFKDKHADLLLIGEEKNTIFVSKILVHLYMTIVHMIDHMIIVRKLLAQKKY